MKRNISYKISCHDSHPYNCFEEFYAYYLLKAFRGMATQA
jgi:hypothetical protein